MFNYSMFVLYIYADVSMYGCVIFKWILNTYVLELFTYIISYLSVK